MKQKLQITAVNFPGHQTTGEDDFYTHSNQHKIVSAQSTADLLAATLEQQVEEDSSNDALQSLLATAARVSQEYYLNFVCTLTLYKLRYLM